MSLLAGLRVVQVGQGLAAAVCGRLFADTGASVEAVEPGSGTWLSDWLNHGKPLVPMDALAGADIIVTEGTPSSLRQRGCDTAALRVRNPLATLVFIAPHGQTGPDADHPATDLTLLFGSGIARMLTGQVGDLTEPPLRAVGEQSAFLGGIAAACAGMHAALGPTPGAVIDVSAQEALATLAMTELTRAGQTGRSWGRRREGDGNGATVCILPASDGFAAISPREDKQWASWLAAMGSPAWGDDPRFATKQDRSANWDALHALMSAWSRTHTKQWIADTAQAAHVPSFPLREPAEHLDAPQLAERGFYRLQALNGEVVRVPTAPFGLGLHQGRRSVSPDILPGGTAVPRSAADIASRSGPMPLAGVRVLDFSWVIAGPTATRYLAAMGAEVIKVESPGSGDPGRASNLHTVLGQAKRGVVLDLKRPEAVALARALAADCDVLVENFATGVMDRLGLGAAELRAINPDLIYMSASGMGRTGPEARAVAYGTLLQCYAGFAGLNRHEDRPPRVGMAWLDPMCGLMLAFVAAAALWRRQRSGEVARVDFSMIEAMLWTMAEPLLAAQTGSPPRPCGNLSALHAPHGAWRCAGEDDWVAIAVRDDAEWRALCRVTPGLRDFSALDRTGRREAAGSIDTVLADWARPLPATRAAALLVCAGVPAAALAGSRDLVDSPHLRARGFWDATGQGVLPGLPWIASFGRASGVAPGLGADTEAVLRSVLGLDSGQIAALRQGGALG